MQIKMQEVEMLVDDSIMRVVVAAPIQPGTYPGILLYSEIFQLTAPIIRSCQRLAGHGFVVAAPEVYHRIERPGTVIPYDDIGRIWGNDDARRTSPANHDADCRAVLDYLKQHSAVGANALGTIGFCLGGHLAFRATLQPDVLAGVCCYPTGVHSNKIGPATTPQDADTLARIGETKAELLMVFGAKDPHVPSEGREIIKAGLQAAGVNYRVMEMEGAEHAFMRDEGYRYDSAAADTVWAEAISLFKRTLTK